MNLQFWKWAGLSKLDPSIVVLNSNIAIFSFENKENKYRLVKREDRQKGPEMKKLEINIKSEKGQKACKLPQYLQDLMDKLVSAWTADMEWAYVNMVKHISFYDSNICSGYQDIVDWVRFPLVYHSFLH